MRRRNEPGAMGLPSFMFLSPMSALQHIVADLSQTSRGVRKVPKTGVLDSEQERDHRQGSVFTGAGRGDGAAAAAAVTDTKILIY